MLAKEDIPLNHKRKPRTLSESLTRSADSAPAEMALRQCKFM